jgi:hypothetical protein
MRRITRERGPWITEADTERRYKDGSKREIVVTVEPRGVRLRAKGTRSTVWVSWSMIYLKGCELATPAKRVRITRNAV